jgi:hypothetical protein
MHDDTPIGVLHADQVAVAEQNVGAMFGTVGGEHVGSP